MTRKKSAKTKKTLSDLVIVYITMIIIMTLSLIARFEIHNKLGNLMHANQFWHFDELLLLWFLSASFCFTWYSFRRKNESRLTEATLIENEAKYSSVVESTDDSIYVVNKEGMYIYMNRKHMSRMGILGASIEGKKYSDFHSPESTRWFISKINSIFLNGKSEHHEYKRGNKYFLQTFSPVKNKHKETISVTIISKNISLLKKEEEKLRHLSFTDELTGIYNRRGFFVLGNQQLMSAGRHNLRLFLLYADLDGLKGINDNLGHETGDLAISDTANVLLETFRKSDIVARIGGDEFAVLITQTPEGDIDRLIARLKDNIESFNNRPNRPYALSLSLGMASYDPGSLFNIEELLCVADKHMYKDKLQKKNEIIATRVDTKKIKEIVNTQKRSSDRIVSEMQAVITFNGNFYEARIKDLSNNSLKVQIISTNVLIDLNTNDELDVKFQTPSGEQVILHCSVLWSRENISHGKTVYLGLRIRQGSSIYEDFYNNLCMDAVSGVTR